MFRAIVGDEFLKMWPWLTELDEVPITPGLTDVPRWIERLGAQTPGIRANA
jgi:hypothetical protein